MVAVRIQVECAKARHAIARAHEIARIPRERDRVARDVHDARGSVGHDGGDDLRARPRTWRVEDHSGGAALRRGCPPPREERKNRRVHRCGIRPATKIRLRVAGGGGIGFDTRHAGTLPGESRCEQSDASIEVQIVRIRVESGARFAHGPRQDRRRISMYLPEAARRPLQDDAADAPRHGDLGAFIDENHRPVVGENQVDGARAGMTPAMLVQILQPRIRERKIFDLDDPMAPRGQRPRPTVAVDVEAHASAPTRSAVAHVPFSHRLHRGVDGVWEAPDSPQRLLQHLRFEKALIGEVEVTKIGASRALRRRAVDACRRPHMRTAMRRRGEDLQRHSTQETRMILHESREHALPRRRFGEEDDLPLVMCDEDAAGGGTLHQQFRGGSGEGSLTESGGTTATRHENDSMTRVLLASTSPSRLDLLRRAGVDPIPLPSSVDETAAVRERESALGHPLSPRETVAVLARAKAEAVAQMGAKGLILGGDSVFAFEGEIWGKPHTPATAVARIRRLRGHSGTLYTGHWLIDARTDAPDAGRGAVDHAEVHFADMDDAEVDAYVRSREPLEVAGSFTLEGLGSAFITRVDGSPSCVQGLSMSTVRMLIRAAGVEWCSLWRSL